MLVHVVQLVATAGVAPDAAGDHQHRDAVEERLGDTARRVRDAGRRHDHQRPEARAGPAHGVRHEGAAALVGHQHGRDARRLLQLVVDLGVVHARDAERVAHADAFQGLAQQGRGGTVHRVGLRARRGR